MTADIPTAVRPFQGADAGAAATLCEEMQAHYGVPCPPREAILADLLALPPGVRLLVAERQGGLCGFAFLSTLFPGPGLRKGLFLKELYVARDARHAGVGRALMAAVASVAVAEGFNRVDWTASAADGRLMHFYEAAGAVPDPRRCFFRLTGNALLALSGT